VKSLRRSPHAYASLIDRMNHCSNFMAAIKEMPHHFCSNTSGCTTHQKHFLIHFFALFFGLSKSRRHYKQQLDEVAVEPTVLLAAMAAMAALLSR
jgi:hypothetical protein